MARQRDATRGRHIATQTGTRAGARLCGSTHGLSEHQTTIHALDAPWSMHIQWGPPIPDVREIWHVDQMWMCCRLGSHGCAHTWPHIACSHPHGHAHRERHTDTRYMYVRRRTLYMCLCNKLIVSLPACVKPYSSWEAGVRNGSMAEPAAYVFWRNHPKKRCVSPEVLFS